MRQSVDTVLKMLYNLKVMRPNYLLFILGLFMICFDMSSIEISDIKAGIEDGVFILRWQVYNNGSQPLYLLNVDNPLVEKKGDILFLRFVMIDSSKSLVLREVPFRSKVKKIEAKQTYSFCFRIEPSQRFESPELTESVMIDFSSGFSSIVVFLGYTCEDIYFISDNDEELELTGREVLKVRADDKVFWDIRKVSQDIVSKSKREDFITILDTQQVVDFEIPMD